MSNPLIKREYSFRPLNCSFYTKSIFSALHHAKNMWAVNCRLHRSWCVFPFIIFHVAEILTYLMQNVYFPSLYLRTVLQNLLLTASQNPHYKTWSCNLLVSLQMLHLVPMSYNASHIFSIFDISNTLIVSLRTIYYQ